MGKFSFFKKKNSTFSIVGNGSCSKMERAQFYECGTTIGEHDTGLHKKI